MTTQELVSLIGLVSGVVLLAAGALAWLASTRD